MYKAFTDEQEQEVCQRYLQGEPASSIANSFNRTYTAVYGTLDRHGIPRRPSGRIPSIDPEQILSFYQKGFSDSQIASKLNCNKSLVQTCIYRKFPEVRRNKSESQKLRDATQKRKWKNGKPSLRGTNNPFWKGGKTEIGYSIRADALYKQWRKSIFERDNYICQQCGLRTQPGQKVILHADHIKPLCSLIDENNIKTIEDARNCEAVWDVSNGRTLCRSCHKKTKTYGVNRHIK